jgi:thioredoxin 2
MMTNDSVIVKCPNCGAKNRIRTTKVQEGYAPRCGKCNTPLKMEEGKPVVVTDATFQQEVVQSSLPVLLDCWAAWCGPCRMLAPIIDQLASELAGRVKIAKLNVDENQQTAAQFGVQGIPTMLIFKNGQVVDRLVGVQPKPAIMGRINRYI